MIPLCVELSTLTLAQKQQAMNIELIQEQRTLGLEPFLSLVNLQCNQKSAATSTIIFSIL